MNYYETLYIVHPALESGRLKDIILSLEEALKKSGGKTLSIDIWGKKKLAYLIDKQKYGTYVQFQFTGEGNCTSSFGLELEHNPNVLSYLTTIIEESDVIKQENNIDSQIEGQSREAQKIDSRSAKSDKKTEPEIEKSSETDGEEDPASGNNVDDSEDKSEAEKPASSEKNTDSVKTNQGNIDETVTVSEEE